MTFKEKYLAGEIRFEEIDDYIEIWNNSDDERTLAQFLGLSADEEDVWIDDSDEALKAMLDQEALASLSPQAKEKKGVWENEDSNTGKNRDHSQQERVRCAADPEDHKG